MVHGWQQDYEREDKGIGITAVTGRLDMEYLLNNEMERLKKLIMGEVKKSPRISLEPKKYMVFCEGDTGAGTGL